MVLLVTHITISHDFTSSSSVGLILDYWKLRRAASVEKCGLNSNACFVASLTSPVSISSVINCLLVLLFCVYLWVWVHVWRLFGLVGSIIRICHHHSLPAFFCLFWCYYSIIIISFQLLLLHIVFNAWFHVRDRVCVVYAWECVWAFFVIFFMCSLLFPLQ